MAQYIYTLEKARKAHGDKVVLDDVTLSFLPGAKIGVVGPNGAGKSSLLRIMAGDDRPSNGEARLMPGFTVGLLAQEPPLDESKTVLGNIEEAVAETKAKLARFNEIAEQMATDYSDELMDEMGRLQEELDHADAWDVDSQLEQAMDALRCPPPDADVTQLSGGERRRVALCKLLLEQPDLLLLDEPTNHLDAESVQWLEQHLAKYPGHRHRHHARPVLPGQRGPVDPRTGPRPRLPVRGQLLDLPGEEGGSGWRSQGRKDAKLQKRLTDELDWVRSNARRRRQTKSKARLERYEEMAAEAEKTRKLDFEEIQIPPGPRLGNMVIEANDLTQGLRRPGADRQPVVLVAPQRHRRHHRPERRRQDHAVQDDRRAGAARLPVRSRSARRSSLSYVDQNRSGLDAKKTVWEVVSDGLDHLMVGKVEMPSRAYVAAFGFKGPDQQKPIGVLSGGERNRLNLALTLKIGGNVLLLDEPTNDLDVETLSSLENALLDFPGCAVVISHDRMFLDRVATHILAWEGDDEDPSQWFWFEGNFEAYEKNKVDRLGADAARPHR